MWNKYIRFANTPYAKRETLHQCTCCGHVYTMSKGILSEDGFSVLCPMCGGRGTIICYKDTAVDAYMKVSYSKYRKIV